MKRQIRVQVEFVTTLDDDGLDIPTVTDIDAKLATVAGLLVPTGVEQTGNKVKITFTRESSFAVKRVLKASTIPA